MTPSISNSIQEGFSAMKRGWRGMLFYSAGWLLLAAAAFLILLPTRPPIRPIINEARISMEEQKRAGDTAEQEAAPADSSVTPDAQPADTVPQQNTPAETAPKREINPAVTEWFFRAWPLGIAALVFFGCGWFWLYCGRIVYLTRKVRGEETGTFECWKHGLRGLRSVTGAAILSLFIVLGILAIYGGICALIWWKVPRVAGGALIALFTLIFVLTFIWLSVRLHFWYLAILADGLSGIEGLRASLRTVDGQWWRTAGLLVMLWLFMAGFEVTLGLLQGFGETVLPALQFWFASGFFLIACALRVAFEFFSTAAELKFYISSKERPSAGTISVSA